MGSRKAKGKVLALLQGRDFEHILSELETLQVNEVIHALFSAICSSDETVHWNGVRCMGICVAQLAEQNMEDARIVMRRLLWSLNDESGGIGWGAPESLAEIMYHHEGLAAEYMHMLISYMREDGDELFQDGNYLEHEILQRGLLWGIVRLAATRSQMLIERNAAAELTAYLQSADTLVRGLAVRALGLLRAGKSLEAISGFLDDPAPISFFDGDRVQSTTLGTLARQAVQQIQGVEVS